MDDGSRFSNPLGPACRVVRNEAGVITHVEDSVTSLLGWRPDQLIGTPSTALIHPNDQASAVSAWFGMINVPGSTRKWRGRYRTVEGKWRWVETINTNRLEDPESPGVFTTMQPGQADFVNVEEELRAREELISRLSEALPVGIFQVDTDHRVFATNGRMHQILGTPPSGDLASQFAGLGNGDWDRLVAAVETALRGEDIDDLELRFSADSSSEPTLTRACQVSLRPLTDGTRAVIGAVGTLSDVTDSVELRRELELRASVDSLTRCLNRGATFEMLERALRAAATAKTGVAAIYIDLDRFKGINDSYGHAAGDQVLLASSDKIRSVLRGEDVVGRLGGDEFLVVCPGISWADEGLRVAERIASSLRFRMPVAEGHITLRASVGFAWTIASDESPDALVARADAAMYTSKLDGVGSVVQAPAFGMT